MILPVFASLLLQPWSGDVVRVPHPVGAQLATTVEAECSDGPVSLSWRTGERNVWIARSGGQARAVSDHAFVADVFGQRTQPVSFWVRCESDGIVTIGYRLVRHGAETPQFASGVIEVSLDGSIVSYTGLEVELPEHFNADLDSRDGLLPGY